MANAIRNLTPEQVANDVLLALAQRGRMSEVAVRQVIKLACWVVSNKKGKRDKCAYWSEKAAACRRSWANCPNGAEWPKDHGLVHEHIVPRKYIENAVYALPHPTLQEVRALLDLSENCLVTECEDRRFGEHNLKQTMPDGFMLPEGKWARYDAAGIPRHCGPHPASNNVLQATPEKPSAPEHER